MTHLYQRASVSKGIAIDDRELYEELVYSHGRDLYRFAFRLSGDADRADDLVQETMYHAWRSIHLLRDRANARAWLLGILRNRFKHLLRTQGRRIKTDPGELDLQGAADPSGTDVLETISNQELLQVALNALDDRDKEPFLLVFTQDLTCREAAELLDIPLGTVLSRIHRARRLLRSYVRQLDPAGDTWREDRDSDELPEDASRLRQELSSDDE